MTQIEVPTPSELKRARQIAGLTQGELADRAGVSQVAISKIERGENDPRLSTVAAIAETLNSEQ